MRPRTWEKIHILCIIQTKLTLFKVVDAVNQENPNIGTTTEDRAGRGVRDHAEREPGDRDPPLQRQVRVEERDR